MCSKARQTSTEDPEANNMSKSLLPFASPSAKMMFDTGDTGADLYFGMTGDDDTDKIRAVQSSIPGGDAIDARDIMLNNSVTTSPVLSAG